MNQAKLKWENNRVTLSFFSVKIPFQPLFKKIGKKMAFQKGDFSATFSAMFKESAPVSLVYLYNWWYEYLGPSALGPSEKV
jgi:hypothetical protein